jgi:hypothetical protein
MLFPLQSRLKQNPREQKRLRPCATPAVEQGGPARQSRRAAGDLDELDCRRLVPNRVGRVRLRHAVLRFARRVEFRIRRVKWLTKPCNV